jgi:hypothetical protein
MKNLIKLILVLTILVSIGCKDEAEKPKVSYKNSDKKIESQKQDTTKIAVSGLPIQFDLTDYLIYPIGNINSVYDGSGKIYESRWEDSPNYNIANYMDNEITGYLQNLKFQKIDSDSLVSLTKKPILIQSVNYLPTIAIKTRQQTLLYLLADADTNKDGKLETNDIRSLYLSDISGSRFTKISTDVQEVLDWKIIESKNRLYYRSIEDTNKNGKFDKNDKVHYNYVNLLEKDWKASEFMPN